MAGNNFFHFNKFNSQFNLNNRDSVNYMNVSSFEEPFRGEMNQDGNTLNKNYTDESFCSGNMNLATSSKFDSQDQTTSSFTANRSNIFQQSLPGTFDSFPNMLPTNIPPPPSAQHYPASIVMPPFNPANPIPQMTPPFGIPPFPPPISSIGPPPCWPASVDTSLPPPLFCESNSVSIEDWMNNWQSRRNIIRGIEPAPKKHVMISQYKNKIRNLANQIKTLEKLTTHLQIMSKSLDEAEWSVRKSEIIIQKKAVVDAMNDLKAIPHEHISFLLKKRKGKRLRLKRKREEWKTFKKEEKALHQLETSRIDMWLEKMKEQVDRARREEDIKKEADNVLSEVFHKKAEAKRMLSLLTTLGKLRNARIQDRESKGEFVSKEAAEAFNSIIDTLKKRWLSQINGYNLEEQGLRVMLSDAEVKRSNVEKLMYKQIHQQWLNLLFGKNHVNSFEVSSAEDLISIRNKWDIFVVDGNSSATGSSIPCGWVLPSTASNESWALYLEN